MSSNQTIRRSVGVFARVAAVVVLAGTFGTSCGIVESQSGSGNGTLGEGALDSLRRVFPGAEGYGTEQNAGKGGRIIRVTNLNDNGDGSLRAALEDTIRRTIIFEISGTIFVNTTLRVTENSVTVAGQTAPSPGITVAPGPGLTNNQLFVVRADSVLIQHIRIRAREDIPDAVLFNLSHTDIVLDHVSMGWASDEVLSTVGGGSGEGRVTVSNSIIHEAVDKLDGTGGTFGGKGFLLGDNTRDLAMLRNLYIHNFDRNPSIKGGTRSLHVNNLVYNGGSLVRGLLFTIDDGSHQGPILISIWGNKVTDGPTSSGDGYIGFGGNLKPGTRYFASDNVFPGGIRIDNFIRDNVTRENVTPFPLPSPLTVLPSGDVEAFVIDNVGARPADRDLVDTRLIDDVRNGTGARIIAIDSVGGHPNEAGMRRDLTVPDESWKDENQDGYTDLQAWIHVFTLCVEGRMTDLERLFESAGLARLFPDFESTGRALCEDLKVIK